MKPEDFNKLVENRLEKIKTILVKKSVEYSTQEDKLINFRKGAIKSGLSPIEVLQGYLLKHEVSFADMCIKFKDSNKVSKEMIDEKITDIINYYLLAEAIFMEENINTNNLINKLKSDE